jgi:hypothetical protein
MQIRFKAYLQFTFVRRLLRDWLQNGRSDAEARASPSLSLVAIILALFLIILEIDAHRDALEAIGLARNCALNEPHFLSP